MSTLDRFASEKLAALEFASLRRAPLATDRSAFPTVSRDGRRLVSFSCNDYLGLAIDPRVAAAAKAALDAYGLGAGGSRLVSGEHPLYAALESRLAAMKKTDGACVFGSGYLANIGVIGALASPDDLLLIDELAHNCLHAGATLSRAAIRRFRHNDADQVAQLLGSARADHRHAFVVTETVFSMDGDRAPLSTLADAAARHDAWLVSDDAHGFGVVEGGDAIIPVQLGTLSKSVGAYGGYCCASEPVCALLKSRARPLMFSTALPPAVLAGAVAALDIMAAHPDLTAAPLRKARLFTELLGLPLAESAIVPLILGAPGEALAASAALAEAGFLVTAIRPPTVPPGTARLRFAFSALHDDRDIERLAAVLRTTSGVAHALERWRMAPCPAYS